MTSRAARFLAATFCLSCSTAGLAQNPAAAPSAETVIRITAHEVVLDIVATDANGAPIPNLTEGDFVVKENGRRQQPDAFSAHFVVPGVRTVAAPALPPGIFSNAIQLGIPAAPVSVILLDLRNMGPANQTIAQTQLLPLLRRLPAGQQVALFTLTDQLHLINGVTSDPEELVSALTEGTGKASRNYLNPLPQSGGGTIYREQIEATIDGVLQMREFLAAIPGRKNLIWLASRFPSSFTDVGLDPLDAGKLQQLATELNFTQTAIYPIDVTGVQGLRAGKLSAEEELADGTGGKSFYSNNDVGALVAEAMKNGTNYYRLSYSPINHNYNGAYRRISVTLDRHGAQLQYRQGYFAIDKEKQLTPTELALLFGTPPQSGIIFTARVLGPRPDNPGSTSVSLAPRPGMSAPRTYELACIAHPEQIATTLGSDGVRHSDMTLVTVAYDSAGNVLKGVQGQYAWTMTPAQWTSIERDGYVMVQQITLPMRTAALRIGLVDKTNSHTGSIQIPASALPTKP